MKRPTLNRRLTLEKPIDTQDDRGGFSRRWVSLGYLWGAVMSPSAPGLKASGDFPQTHRRLRIIVRSAPTGAQSRPQPNQRFKENDRIFDILGVETAANAPGYLICYCQNEEMA